ncbi:MAG: Ig-like domain-containing protein, partial [Bacteroidota bacterium]
AEFGNGAADDPFLLDIAQGIRIDLIDLRDTAADRSLNDFLEWTSSNPDVAVVDHGLVLGLEEGNTTISAAKRVDDDRSIDMGSWEVRVFEFERIEISSETGVLAVLQGRELQLRALYYDAANAPDPSVQVTWRSKDIGIAQVNQEGLVSGLAVGTATIEALLAGGETTAEVSFQVLDNEVDVFTVSIENQMQSIMVDDSIQLRAVAYSVNNIEVPGESFTWTSQIPAIIEVNDEGLAIAKARGTSSIWATSSSGVQSEAFELTATAEEVTSRVGSIVTSRGGTTGTVTVFINDQDILSVRLNEDFFGANIPGPVLFLSNSETSVSGGVRIQEIDPGDGNNREFAVPGNPGIGDYDYVIYYCEPFSIIYGSYLLD